MRISDWSSDVCSSDLSKPAPLIKAPASSPARKVGAAVRCGSGFSVISLAAPMPLESEEAADATLLRIGMPAGSQLVIPLPANAVRAAAIRNGLSALNIGAHIPFPTQIGRASCRERVCPYV